MAVRLLHYTLRPLLMSHSFDATCSLELDSISSETLGLVAMRSKDFAGLRALFKQGYSFSSEVINSRWSSLFQMARDSFERLAFLASVGVQLHESELLSLIKRPAFSLQKLQLLLEGGVTFPQSAIEIVKSLKNHPQHAAFLDELRSRNLTA